MEREHPIRSSPEGNFIALGKLPMFPARIMR